MRIAILDDYQNVARSFADWDRLDAEITVFTEHIPGPDDVVAALAGFDVVVAMRERTRFSADVLRRLPDLKLLVSTGQRNAAIDVAAANEQGIVVSGTGYIPYPTAEHTWALILAAARHIPEEERNVRESGWQRTVGMSLHGKTLGLIGLGRLGSTVAGIGKAYGMNPIAWSQNLTEERAAEHGVRAVSREELLRTADVVSIHLVLSKRTRGLLGKDDLALMKPGAILVNTSRGPIVDENALIDAVTDGGIRAALDVYDTEPLPADHPIRQAPNTVLTPHIGYVADDVYTVFFQDAVEDIAAFAAGEPVRVMSAG
ncbi:MAG: D-2-hydroxyacid dehydrogenase family protein [Actinophytocola sp.]|nr:D-2-hydroxyacid dehydrogenase family protein [Actinophytocola sp.]